MPLANMVSFISCQPGSVIDGALRNELEGTVNVVAQYQELLGSSIDRASALQGQIRDQLADSMNTATYRFTWVATVFLPLSFLTGLLGINVAGIPGAPGRSGSFCGRTRPPSRPQTGEARQRRGGWNRTRVRKAGRIPRIPRREI
jgi:hypothetical protein